MSGKGMKTFIKQFRTKAVVVSGAECTPEMLAKINQFALVTLAAEDVYIRKFLMSHNCIDRDNECFPDEMLDQFAATMPGKACIPSHDRKTMPLATWFDSSTEYMSPDQFKALTTEEPKLPEGVAQVKVQWSWMYTLVKDWTEQLRDSIDGGIIRSCSIGFAAADLTAVRKDPNGPALYYQYCCPGEALEGSLVWLGAQPGATAQKSLKDKETHTEEVKHMKSIIALLVGMGFKTLTDTATEDQIATGIKTLVDEKDAKIKELEGKAAEGDAYRSDLITDTVKFAALLEEIGSDEKAAKDEAEFLKTVPIARLKSQRDKYEAKAREKFPTHTIFTGKDQGDREQRGKDGEKTSQVTKGKKDFSNPMHNELFGTVAR